MEKRKFGQLMTEGSIAKLLVRFAVPLLLANLLQQLYNSVDMMIVGRVVGETGTVGVSNGGEIAALATFAGMAFGSAAQVYAAQLVGAGRREEMPRVSGTILSFMLLFGMVMALICMALCRPLIAMLNCPAEAFDQACGYMYAVSAGLPCVFGYNAVCGIMRGMGESRKPLVFVGIAAAVNVALDVLLVKVIPLRALGSGIATAVSQAMSFAAAILYMYRRRRETGFCCKREHFRIRREHMGPLLKIGIPLTLQSTFIHLSQIVCISWVNTFGLLAASANSIGAKLHRLISVVTNSVTGAAGAVVAQNLGAQKYGRVKRTVYVATLLCLVVCVAEFVVALAWPEELFALFSSDEQVIRMGRTYLQISLITFILSAVQGPLTAVVTGSGNARLSFAYGLVDGLVIRMGVSYVLSFMCGMGIVGYWYGNALAHLGPVVIAAVYFFSGRWRTYQLLRRQEEGTRA